MRTIRGNELPFVAASHEDPLRPGVVKKVLAVKEELLPGAPQMINWAVLPAGNSFARHYHEDMQEIFVIVAGQVEVQVEDSRIVLERGDTIAIDPREQHSMRNIGAQDAEYIVLGISLGRGGRTIVA